MKLDKLHACFAALLAAALLVLGPTSAYAFSTKTHVILANQVLADARDGKLSVPGLGNLDPQNQEIINAILRFPEAFRAGVLGPDNYPDLIGGQIWVHANRGTNALNKKFEERTLSQFRSIDYGMYLLSRARGLPAGNARLEAIAFAYGYLAHMIADGFAHSYVNEWAGGAWSYTKGSGLYGTVTQELKHLAVEGLLDNMMAPVNDSELAIAAPVGFLDSLFRFPVALATKTEPAGAFAGDHIRAILTLRDKLRRAANGDFPGVLGEISEFFVDVHEAAAMAGLPNPVADIQWFLRVRADMLDEVVANLPLLSDCIAQNIIRGQNRIDNKPLTKDACDAIDFEPPGSNARFIFQGALNDVAHDGDSTRPHPLRDPGSFAMNIQRILDYLTMVLQEGMSFDPRRDLRVAGEIHKRFDICRPVVEWGGCERACDAAANACTKAINQAACFACPTSGGEFSCTHNRKAKWRCAFMPHCWKCDALPAFQKLTGGACEQGVNLAAPACELCGKNSLCIATEAIETVYGFVAGEIEDRLTEALQPLLDIAMEAVMTVVFGRYYDEVQDALAIYDMRKRRGSPVWLVNAAFFAEDMRAGGLPYLIQLFNRAVGVPLSAMSTAQSAAQFASSTWKYMTTLSPMGEEIIWGDPNTHADDFSVYENFIKFLYGLIDGSSEAVLKDEFNYWANRVSVQKENRRRVAVNFVRLLDTLGMLHTFGGPTATALAQEMANQSFDWKDYLNVRSDLNAFAPVYNSIQLTKLSLFSPSVLQQKLGKSVVSTHSAICQQHPHIMCDGIASLDDPNHHGPDASPDAIDPPADQRFPLGTKSDPERSVLLWAPRQISWSSEGIRPVGPCVAARTALPLTHDPTVVRDGYERIFMVPEGCLTSTMAAAFMAIH